MRSAKSFFANAIMGATLGFVACGTQAATAAVAAPLAGLPSCTVVPSQTPNAAPVYIEVDAHGRFYATQVVTTPGGGLTSSQMYLTTDELEVLCGRGIKVAFWGADRFATLPSPYLFVQEYKNADTLPNYVLSAREEDRLFIFSGNAGPNWRPTLLRLRLPRVATDLVPVHVFFGSDQPGVVTHFYTADPAEYDAMMRKVTAPANANIKWAYERVAFYAPRVSVLNGAASCASADMAPVFRLAGTSNSNSQPKYRYVANRETIASMQRAGYQVQAAAFCALVD
jgi:hypothetical protein